MHRIALTWERASLKLALLSKYVEDCSICHSQYDFVLNFLLVLLPGRKITDGVFSRELKKAQMAKAAAEERAQSTDRMTTRSTTQNRTTRLAGKKMNRSVSLTIY